MNSSLKLVDSSQNAAIDSLRHDDEFVREVIKTPRLTKQIVRERAEQKHSPTVAAKPLAIEAGCPTEKREHLAYAVAVLGKLLAASPDDECSKRYKRWINILSDDLADEQDRNTEKESQAPVFRGQVDSFLRQPQKVHGWKAI